MINFWGIQRSFLIIRSTSSGRKYRFSGRRGAVNGQQFIVMDAARAEASLWTQPSSLSVALRQCWEAMSYGQVWFLWSSARGCHAAHAPQAAGGYQGDNLAEPQPLVMVSQPHSLQWELQEIPVPTEAVLCVLILCRGCEGRGGFTSPCSDRPTSLVCLWRVTSWNQDADQECSEYLKKILCLWFLHHPSSLLKK